MQKIDKNLSMSKIFDQLISSSNSLVVLDETNSPVGIIDQTTLLKSLKNSANFDGQH